MTEDDDDDLGPANEDDDRLASLSERFGELHNAYAVLLDEVHVRTKVAGTSSAAWTPWRCACRQATS